MEQNGHFMKNFASVKALKAPHIVVVMMNRADFICFHFR